MGSELSRRGGASNMPVSAAGLGRVTVGASKFGGAAIGVAAGATGLEVWHHLNIPNGNVPDFVQHLPFGVGHVVNDALVGAGHVMIGIEHIPVAGPAVTVGLAGSAAVGAGYLGYKYIGKGLQRRAKELADRHHL